VDASVEYRARNEVLFREVNERVEEVNRGLDGGRNERMTFVCECGNTDCLEQIELTRPQYEAIRTNPKQFAVLPGHEDTRIAHVIEEHQGFLIVEKHGEAAEISVEHDPRA
jgi:hypothetical protein